MASPESIALLEALRSPTEAERDAAVRRIFDSYFQRLWRLAWSQMHPRIRQRVDPDDLINSGLKSLVLDFAAGKPFLADQESLWGLLAGAVISKVRQAAREHRAGKRDVFREVNQVADSSADPMWGYLATLEATPLDALCLQEAIEGLSEQLQTVALGKLHGKTDEELANEMGYSSTETIRLAKRQIEKKWRIALDQN